MKKLLLFTAFCALCCATPLTAQEVVFNGDFELESATPAWTYVGGNLHTTMATFETVLGQPSYCLKRRPGTPSDNGGIEQQVHLFAGMKYSFSANIAAEECG